VQNRKRKPTFSLPAAVSAAPVSHQQPDGSWTLHRKREQL